MTKMKMLIMSFLLAVIGAVNAHADLKTDMATITKAATDGVTTVSTSQATVIAAVFGLILLAVGARWIFGSIKAR